MAKVEAIAKLRQVARDGVALIGAGTAAYGAWLAWVPAGFLVGGAALVAAAFISNARATAQ